MAAARAAHAQMVAKARLMQYLFVLREAMVLFPVLREQVSPKANPNADPDNRRDGARAAQRSVFRAPWGKSL
jgi:hypothetical protein